MTYFTREFVKFFTELKNNNDREWFKANKKRFEAHVKQPFEAFIQACIQEAKKIDENIAISAKDAVFRIHRDVRFSKDKRPYKNHLGAVVSAGGRKSNEIPGYYVHASAKNLMLGGGAYFLSREKLFKVREEIAYYPKEFEKIINSKKFKEHYKEIQGEKNKIIPKDFKEDFAKQPLIANKQFFYMAELKPSIFTSKDLMKTVRAHFKAGAKLNDFLRRAMYD